MESTTGVSTAGPGKSTQSYVHDAEVFLKMANFSNDAQAGNR